MSTTANHPVKTQQVPEVTSCGNLADKDRESGQGRTVMTPCSSFQLKETVQMATEQVETSCLKVLGGLHGTPNTLGNLQKELDLRGHGVELVLPLTL